MQLLGVLWDRERSSFHSLTSSGVSSWELDEVSGRLVLSWDVHRVLTDSIADAVWVRGPCGPVCHTQTGRRRQMHKGGGAVSMAVSPQIC